MSDIAVHELAEQIGVPTWRVQRYLDRRAHHKATSFPTTMLSEEVANEVRCHFVTRAASQWGVTIAPEEVAGEETELDPSFHHVVAAGSPGKITSHPYVCPECGRKTRVGTGSGAVYSHNKPNVEPAELCPESGRQLHARVDPVVAPDKIPLRPPRTPGAAEQAKPRRYFDEDKADRRVILAGLPGLGRRY